MDIPTGFSYDCPDWLTKKTKQQQKKDQDTSTEDQGDVFVPLGSFVDLGIQDETITIEGSKDMEKTFFLWLSQKE